MADETLRVQPLRTRLWNAFFGRSPAPGSGANRSTQGEAPIRVSSNLVQKKRQIGNRTFRLPGPSRPRVSYGRALSIRAGRLDHNFENGRIWFAEELNRERGIFVQAEGGYRLVDYDDQGKEIASQDVPTTLLGHPQNEDDQGLRTLENLRLVSVKDDQLPRYHFWKRDDEVEPVGRISELPQVPTEPPRKRDDKPQWKITADAVDRAFAMNRCRTYKPPAFEERGERIPNFNIANNAEHCEKFRVKRREILRIFEVQKKDLFDIVNDTFDPSQKQFLLPALYINAVHERQEQDKVKYAKALGENDVYRDYPDNAITKMTMLWFGLPIAPLRYMEVIHDYTKDPDGIPEPEPNLSRFERITESEAPLEFLDMFDERSFGYPMLRLKRPSPEELERRAQLLEETKTSSVIGPGETNKQTSDNTPTQAGRTQGGRLAQDGSVPPKPLGISKSLSEAIKKAQHILATSAVGGGSPHSVRGGGRGRAAGRGRGPPGKIPTVAGPSISTTPAGRGFKQIVPAASAPSVASQVPIKPSANAHHLGGGYVPTLRGGEYSDDETSELLKTYEEVDEAQTGHRMRPLVGQRQGYQHQSTQSAPDQGNDRIRARSRRADETRAESAQPSNLQPPGSQLRNTRAHSTQNQTASTTPSPNVRHQYVESRNQADRSQQQSQRTGSGNTKTPSSQNQEARTGKGYIRPRAPITPEFRNTPQDQLVSAKIWGPQMDEVFRSSWSEITSRGDFVRLANHHMREKIRGIDGVRFVLNTMHPKPSPVFTVDDKFTGAEFPNILQPPESIWIIPYWETIEISDVTPSHDLSDPDTSTHPGAIVNWSHDQTMAGLRKCLKELYDGDWDDREEVIVRFFRHGNVPGELTLTNFTHETDFWYMMNDLVIPELYIKRLSALDPKYRPPKPAPVRRPQIVGTTEAPAAYSPSMTGALPMEGATVTQTEAAEEPAAQGADPSNNVSAPTTNDGNGSINVFPYHEAILRRSLGLSEPKKAVHPNLVRYVEPRSKKRSRTEWEEWVLNEERKDRKKHDEYTMDRSIFSDDDPPLIPVSGRPVQQGITGGPSVATVYTRNVTATDQARLQRQRRKLENIYLDRIQACPICPAEFPPGPEHMHEVEAHWQWHRDRLMEDKACPVCGDKEWVSFNLDLKRKHIQDHTRLDLETCPAVGCNTNLRDPGTFPKIAEAAAHVLGHRAPPDTDSFSRLGKQQAMLRHAIHMTGVPALRDAHCNWVLPNGVWCGEDLNDMTKYGDWQRVCEHLYDHLPPRPSNSQPKTATPAIRGEAAAPRDNYACRMVVDGKRCHHVARDFDNFYQHIITMHRGPMSCHLCGAHLSSELSFISHLNTEHPAKITRYLCPAGAGGSNACGRQFASEQLRFEHILAEHGAERHAVIKCHRSDGCTFQTQDSLAFDEHLRSHESRALRCGECSYVSYNGENLDALREHLAGHAEAKAAAGTGKIGVSTDMTATITGPPDVLRTIPAGPAITIARSSSAEVESKVEGSKTGTTADYNVLKLEAKSSQGESPGIEDSSTVRPGSKTPNRRSLSPHCELGDESSTDISTSARMARDTNPGRRHTCGATTVG